MILQNN